MLDKSVMSASESSKNLSDEEIARFDALAESWWDPQGKYKTALAFNAARVDVILRQIREHFAISQTGEQPLANLTLLDVGCGGGLISEPMAKAGASVTGIDASAVSIEVAKRHARHSGVEVTYEHLLASQINKQQQYDVVINAEVVEHVPDQPALIQDCARLVKPGGMLILATLNRTVRSYIIAIVGAEYVMRYLPVGTHSWKKFVKPDELADWVGPGFTLKYETGMKLNPLSGHWSLTSSTAVNYLQCYYSQK